MKKVLNILRIIISHESHSMRRSISNNMKLAIVLLIVPHISAVVLNTYQGFENCGFNGWICHFDFQDEIIFDCSASRSQDARIWIWTARLPKSTTELTVRNCNNLEVHVDCTPNSRDNIIQKVQFINITKLCILSPSPRYEYLHDNNPVANMPPYLRLENVGVTSFYAGLFHKLDENQCNPDLGKMKVLIMKNVTVSDIPQNTFLNSIQEMVWVNVRVKKMAARSINVNASVVLIQDSTFPDLATEVFNIKGQEIEFLNNSIKNISPSAIKVFSNSFIFKRNKIESILTHGLVVLGTHINIQTNKINHLGKGAFEAISPSYYFYEKIASNLSYSFIGNILEELSPFSLHANWSAYKDVCTTIKFYANKFDCSCSNLAWLRDSSKMRENSGFYNIIFENTQRCGSSFNCSLRSIAQNVCKNITSTEKLCPSITETNTRADVNDTNQIAVTDDYNNIIQNAEKEFYYNSIRPNEASDSEKMILDSSYFQDQSKSVSDATAGTLPAWTIALIILVLALLTGLAIFIWLAKRRKNFNEVNVYRYDKNNDSDNLIINDKTDVTNTECENAAYEWSPLERVETAPTVSTS